MQTMTVTDSSSFQLSTVLDGTFYIAYGQSSSKLYAGLGATDPFASSPPGVFAIFQDTHSLNSR